MHHFSKLHTFPIMQSPHLLLQSSFLLILFNRFRTIPMMQSPIILPNSSSHFILFNRPYDTIYSISTKELLSFDPFNRFRTIPMMQSTPILQNSSSFPSTLRLLMSPYRRDCKSYRGHPFKTDTGPIYNLP